MLLQAPTVPASLPAHPDSQHAGPVHVEIRVADEVFVLGEMGGERGQGNGVVRLPAVEHIAPGTVGVGESHQIPAGEPTVPVEDVVDRGQVTVVE
jgi:hypothetical protein